MDEKPPWGLCYISKRNGIKELNFLLLPGKKEKIFPKLLICNKMVSYLFIHIMKGWRGTIYESMTDRHCKFI